MKHIPTIIGALMGLLFVMSGVVVLFGLVEGPPPAEGSPAAHFMAAFVPTGYLTLVKVLEIVGGLLVLVPRTRNLGLLVLGPILVNILAFHIFVDGKGLLNPMIIFLCGAALYLMWVERRAWLGLVRR